MKDCYYSEQLDGKKVIFIGNSMIYYGQCVEDKKQVCEQGLREKDRGYFYQLCASHGVDVSVTNWTFGGHQLAEIFADTCPYCLEKGWGERAHMPFLKDRQYDYVIISEGSHLQNNFVAMMDRIITTFCVANPYTKFVYLCHLRQHMLNRTDVLHELKTVAEQGVIICDWGKVLFDVLNGKQVPGGKATYNNNSFLVSRSETDGQHGNLLSGYLTALATYCAITKKKAEGQRYDFYDDTAKNPAFDIEAFKTKNYCYGDTETNFDRIFTMPEEMLGLQKLVDETLAQEAWRQYGEEAKD